MPKKVAGNNSTRLTNGRLPRLSLTMQPARRSLLWFAALVPVLMACARGGTSFAGDRGGAGNPSRDRKIPLGTLYLDARDNTCGVKIHNEMGHEIGGGSLLNLRTAKKYSFPGGERGLPASIRATWSTCQRTPSGAYTGIGSTPLGDHTAAVAERIPAEVIDYLRTKGGALRIKVRIVDTGVLVGWDIETRVVGQAEDNGKAPSAIRYVMAGGDFCERQVYAGQVVEPGWEHAPSSIDNMARGGRLPPAPGGAT